MMGAGVCVAREERVCHAQPKYICIHVFRMVLLKQRDAGVAQLVERNLAKV